MYEWVRLVAQAAAASLYMVTPMKHDPESAVVVLSGGQDSTTCLYVALQEGLKVHAVTFDYGQRHRREIDAARTVAHFAGVTHEVINVAGTLQGTSPLVSSETLEEYADHTSLPGGLEKTFVPMRNQMFLTIAANRAYVRGSNLLFTGVCETDFGGYPDCRMGFLRSLERTSSLGTFTDEKDTLPDLEIRAPLMHLTKAESVRLALEIPGCYEALAFTHTSYAGEYPPSSKDHASLLRSRGFEEAGVPDPLVLRAYIDGALTELPEGINYQPDVIGPYVDRVAHALRELEGKGVFSV